MSSLLADAATIPSWAIQLGIATPFILALAFVGKWLLERLKMVETEKKALYDKLIDEILPALKSSTDISEKLIEQFGNLNEQRNVATSLSAELRQKLLELVQAQKDAIAFSEELRRRELALARAQRRGGV